MDASTNLVNERIPDKDEHGNFVIPWTKEDELFDGVFNQPIPKEPETDTVKQQLFHTVHEATESMMSIFKHEQNEEQFILWLDILNKLHKSHYKLK